MAALAVLCTWHGDMSQPQIPCLIHRAKRWSLPCPGVSTTLGSRTQGAGAVAALEGAVHGDASGGAHGAEHVLHMRITNGVHHAPAHNPCAPAPSRLFPYCPRQNLAACPHAPQ